MVILHETVILRVTVILLVLVALMVALGRNCLESATPVGLSFVRVTVIIHVNLIIYMLNCHNSFVQFIIHSCGSYYYYYCYYCSFM